MVLLFTICFTIASSCLCPEKILKDDKCDEACYSAECSWDFGSCASQECDAGCIRSMIGDGKCDTACNTKNCSYDNGDCSECARFCPTSKIANGICDEECNTERCNFDGEDCSEDDTKIFEDNVIIILVACASAFGIILLGVGLLIIYKTKLHTSARIDIMDDEEIEDYLTQIAIVERIQGFIPSLSFSLDITAYEEESCSICL